MAVLVILVTEGHVAVLQGDEPVVRDGHAMGIPGQVREHLRWVLHGLFGVDHPLLVAQRGEEALPGRGLSEFPTATHQGELALRGELRQTREVETPETAREDPDGQEEVGATRPPLGTIRSDAPSGQDTMEMGMMVELLAPGVEHGEAADLRPKMLGVPGDVLERLGARAKE